MSIVLFILVLIAGAFCIAEAAYERDFPSDTFTPFAVMLFAFLFCALHGI